METNMIKSNFTGLFITLALIAMAVGCSNSGGGNQQGGAGDQQVSVPESAQELGKKISNDYWEAMGELKAMVQPKPEAGELKPKVQAMRDKYIERFVAYGKAIEAKGESYKNEVTSAQNRAEAERRYAPNSDAIDISWLGEAVNYYRPKDNDLGNMIADVNIITQYAYFDLLKQQRPKEAERLGIK